MWSLNITVSIYFIYLCIYVYICVSAGVCVHADGGVYIRVYRHTSVYVWVSVCSCTLWYLHLCVVCVCGLMCWYVHPVQMNPLQDSPNSLGVFSGALLYRHSSQTWMFCSQTWIAGSSWPLDICWTPLILTRRWPEQGRAHWIWVWDCSGQ